MKFSAHSTNSRTRHACQVGQPSSIRILPSGVTTLLYCTIPLLICIACGTDPTLVKIGIQNDEPSYIAAEIALAESSQMNPSFRIEACIEKTVCATMPHQAVDSAYQFMGEPDLLAVVGYGSSGATLATAKLFNDAHIPQIVPGATSPLLLVTGPWTFKLCPNDTHQAKFLAEMARGRFRADRCGILYQNNDYGRELCRLFEKEYGGRGGTVVFKAPTGAGGNFEVELGIYAAEILDANPKLLLFLCQPGSAKNIRDALEHLQITTAILASDALCNRNVLRRENASYAGIHVAVFYHHSLPTPGNRQFVRAYMEKTSFYPDPFAALVYDGVRLIRQACDSGVRSREELRSYLLRLGVDLPPFEGVTGSISFNEDRECLRPMYLARIDSDGICLVDSRDEE